MDIRESKRYFIVFYMVGFLVGILYANFLSKDYMANLGIFSGFFLNQYSQMDINTVEYFWYIFRLRLMLVVLTGALGCTGIRKGAAAGFLIWTGLLSGLMLTAASMKMGVKGILLCIVGLLPQYIFYVPAYLILLWCLFCYPQMKWNLTKTVSFLMLMLVGILLECYVNPVIIKLFIRTL